MAYLCTIIYQLLKQINIKLQFRICFYIKK